MSSNIWKPPKFLSGTPPGRRLHTIVYQIRTQRQCLHFGRTKGRTFSSADLGDRVWHGSGLSPFALPFICSQTEGTFDGMNNPNAPLASPVHVRIAAALSRRSIIDQSVIDRSIMDLADKICPETRPTLGLMTRFPPRMPVIRVILRNMNLLMT